VVQSSSGQFVDLSLAASSVLTTAGKAGDTVSGGLTFTITNPDATTTTFTTTATTVSGLISEINKDGIAGVSASLTTQSAVGGTAGATTALADTGILLSNTNTNVAITNAALLDTTTGEAATSLQASTKATETISYQAGANESATNLAATDLTTQGNAQTALTTINAAINNVAAQRGYLGAQVNTLNAVTQVVNTQQENVTAAQNSVQATDYAQATSQMSKYEILSQTGISALAQANSLQQEVTKLLQ
jgi:flagellin